MAFCTGNRISTLELSHHDPSGLVNYIKKGRETSVKGGFEGECNSEEISAEFSEGGGKLSATLEIPKRTTGQETRDKREEKREYAKKLPRDESLPGNCQASISRIHFLAGHCRVREHDAAYRAIQISIWRVASESVILLRLHSLGQEAGTSQDE